MKKVVKYSLIKKAIKVFNFFFSDDTTYYAASLSFFTIFALLPIIALLISIISSMPDFDEYLGVFLDFIFKMLNPIHSATFIKEAKNFIENSDKLGIIGIAYMLFVFTMFAKDYDHIVNKFHQAPSRALYKTFVLYFLLAIAVPILFVLYFFTLSLFKNFVFDFLVSLLYSWFIFFFLFKLSINKTIQSKAILKSSFVTVVALGVTKNLFVYYVIYNKTYTTLYGSFSTLLFFFLWIYLSWAIYLYGIKLCSSLNKELTNF